MSKPRFQISFKTCVASLLIIAATTVVPGCGSPERSANDSSDSAYKRGLAALEMFDFVEAYQELSEFQPTLAQSDPRWMEATYAYAVASWHRPPPDEEKIQQAVGLFRELLEADIPKEWKTRVKLSLARIYEVGDFPDDEIEIERARELYQEIIKEYPTGEFGYQASLRLAQTYVQELDPESVKEGIDTIRAQIERDPNNQWASIAWQYLGDLYNRSLENTKEALAAYREADEIGFANESRTDFYLWLMSEWALELGRTEEAVKLRTRIVEDFPRSPYGTLSRDYVRTYAANHPEKNITPPELHTF